MISDSFFERENKKQLEKILERAKSGDVFAVYTFAEYLYDGIFIDKDVEEAAKWYKLAADEGHAGAIAKLQEMYANGEISKFYVPAYIPTKSQKFQKKSSFTLFSGKKKSDKPRKKVFDGNFSDDDPNLAALFNDEKMGYEDRTMTFDKSYGKKNSNRYNADDDSNDYDY